MPASRSLIPCCAALSLLACADDPKRAIGASCDEDAQCESDLCRSGVCVDPALVVDGEPWQVFFDPNVDLAACGTTASWCCQVLDLDPAARFDQTWGEPAALLRVAGTRDAEGFHAALSCLPDLDPGGSFDAGPHGRDLYAGTWSFAGQGGSVLVGPFSDDVVWMQGRVVAVGSGQPIAGATISSSLDASRATTTAGGLFYLLTTAPIGRGNTPWTVTVAAPGFATRDQTHIWGDHAQGQRFELAPSAR